MQTHEIANGFMSQNTTYDFAKEKADAAKFTDMLQKANERAELARKPLSARTGTPGEEAAEDKKLRDACKDFEAMFLDIMYRQMRSTLPGNSLLGESNADKILQSMQDTELMKHAAESGGIGLADMLYRQLKQEQEAIPAAQIGRK